MVFVVVNDVFRLVGDIVIGNDVWIGVEVMILLGLCIGDGVVIGSWVLVICDVVFYVIVGGNLVKVLCSWFEVEDIVWLLEMVWWEWLLV